MKAFYQRRKESDLFNYDIVSFEYDERYNLLRLTITVNCKELDFEKHKSLINFLGLQDALDGKSLSYYLYKEKLFKMGFEENQ